jgi:hypothetical protein
MTLLTVLLTLITTLKVFAPLGDARPAFLEDASINQIGDESQFATEQQMSREDVGGGHCPRG